MDQEKTEPRHWDNRYSLKNDGPVLATSKKKLKRLFDLPRYRFEKRIHRIASRQQIHRVLEAGCGEARFVFSLSSLAHLSVGVDFSRQAIQKAGKQKAVAEKKGIISLCLAEIENLPFQDNSFDLILSLGVIEHFRDPTPLLKEMMRVLTPGGLLFVEVPNKRSFGRSEGWMARARKIFGYHDFYTDEELSNIIKQVGFRVMKADSLDFAAGIYYWYKAYFSVTYLSNQGFFKYLNRAIALTLYAVFCPLNPFIKHRGAYNIVEATK